jgi:hypothetical protein
MKTTCILAFETIDPYYRRHLFSQSNEKKKESKVGWSRGGSKSGQEEETVDLTEPRFESFCLPNVKPVLLEPSAHI